MVFESEVRHPSSESSLLIPVQDCRYVDHSTIINAESKLFGKLGVVKVSSKDKSYINYRIINLRLVTLEKELVYNGGEKNKVGSVVVVKYERGIISLCCKALT